MTIFKRNFRHKSQTRFCQCLAISPKHRAINNRLGCWNRSIWVAHTCSDNHPAFDNHFGFCAKQCGFPQHQICPFTDLNRTHMFRNAVRNRRINRVFRHVAFYSEIIVVLAFIFGQCAALHFHFMRCLPRPCDDFTDTTHRLRIRTHHAKNAQIMQNILCCNGFRANPRVRKSHIFWNIFVQMVTNHEHIEVFINRIDGKRACRIGRRR